jgi:sporadic carbohydrate cluster 2OG-Fe(II) oxygenase
VAGWTRRAYFNLAQKALYTLIGNELAMQKKFNVNIQLPGDDKSLLPVHADTWTGDSPYQLVCWVPLVDCYRTKSMYILPPGNDFTLEGSSEDVWNRIKDRVKFLDVKYGEVLLFNPTLPHGNRVNEESTTRWTINVRFKNIWSPYGVKGLGEHFEPITLRAASRIGMDYRHPAI